MSHTINISTQEPCWNTKIMRIRAYAPSSTRRWYGVRGPWIQHPCSSGCEGAAHRGHGFGAPPPHGISWRAEATDPAPLLHAATAWCVWAANPPPLLRAATAAQRGEGADLPPPSGDNSVAWWARQGPTLFLFSYNYYRGGVATPAATVRFQPSLLCFFVVVQLSLLQILHLLQW